VAVGWGAALVAGARVGVGGESEPEPKQARRIADPSDRQVVSNADFSSELW
jgi:hypothetical protein